jgi:hypothetical protein
VAGVTSAPTTVTERFGTSAMGISVPSNCEILVSEILRKSMKVDWTYPGYSVLQVVGQVVLNMTWIAGAHFAGLGFLEQCAVQGYRACNLDAGFCSALGYLAAIRGLLGNCGEHGVCADKIGLRRPTRRIRGVECAKEDVDGVRAIAAELVANDVGNVFTAFGRSVLGGGVALGRTGLGFRLRLGRTKIEESLRQETVVARVATIELVDCCFHRRYARVVDQLGICVAETSSRAYKIRGPFVALSVAKERVERCKIDSSVSVHHDNGGKKHTGIAIQDLALRNCV